MASEKILKRGVMPARFSYIHPTIKHTDSRQQRLDTLFTEIEDKGVTQAWLEYIAKDIDDVIAIEGIEKLMNHLDNKSLEAIVKYVITSRC